jgi:hypothetical protein
MNKRLLGFPADVKTFAAEMNGPAGGKPRDLTQGSSIVSSVVIGVTFESHERHTEALRTA